MIQRPCGPRRKSVASAMSSGAPNRPIGTSFTRLSRLAAYSASLKPCRQRGVSIGPGAMTFAVARGASSLASTRVKPKIPAFAAE